MAPHQPTRLQEMKVDRTYTGLKDVEVLKFLNNPTSKVNKNI